MNIKNKLIRFALGFAFFISAIILERSALNADFSLSFYIIAYLFFGGDIVYRAVKNIERGLIFDENFLMSLATIGAFLIGEYAEAVGVMLFYQIGEYFQETAVSKSKKSISSLMDIRPDYANLVKGSVTEKTPPENVKPGDLILVKPGEKIPLDGIVTEGMSVIDTSALTGEPVPRKAEAGTQVISGCVNLNGLLKIKVLKPYGESAVSKIIRLVEEAADKKAKTQNFITSFARYYTPAVVALAVLLAFLPPLLFKEAFSDWINRALVFLVISCPCALVLSIPMGFFAGIGRAAKNGILVKGGNYLEALNNLEIAVFDKTGTLTKGVFKVVSVLPAEGFSESRVMELAALAESYSNHPIALSVTKAYGREIDRSSLSDYAEHAGYGVSVVKDGITIYSGNDKLLEPGTVKDNDIIGTKIHIALLNKNFDFSSCAPARLRADDYKYAGCIVISDELKPDSKKAIASLNVKTVMLTGDNIQNAQSTANMLGMDEVYAGLLPHEKAEKLESLKKQKSKKGVLAFLGDGINDAPVLAMADIGIAMGGLGSDAAIEAADIVLMTDEPSKLVEAIKIARLTKKIVRQNIIFALSFKIVFLALGAFGIAGLWEAVFADVGVALLAVLNAMRIFKKRFA